MQEQRSPAVSQSSISQRYPWTDVNGRKADAESSPIESGLVPKRTFPLTLSSNLNTKSVVWQEHGGYYIGSGWHRRFASTSWFTGEEVTEHYTSPYKLQGPIF